MPNAQFDIDIEAMLKNVDQLEAFGALPPEAQTIVLQRLNNAVFAASLKQENMIAGAAILCPPGQHKDKTTRKCVDNDTAVVESEPPAAAEAATAEAATAEAAADPDAKAAQFAKDEVDRKAQIEAAAKAAAALAATRAINYYARIRPFLKMDQGATAAQGMQAEGKQLRAAAEATAEDIANNYATHFLANDASPKKGVINPATRIKLIGHQCLNFEDMFKDKSYEPLSYKGFHGHERQPPKGHKTKVSFNLVWDDGQIFNNPSHGTEEERIKKNNDEFLVSVWPNVKFFFGTPGKRAPSNVIYVAYGASGAGKTTTTSAILAKWLETVAANGTMDNYSIRIVSDYLNRCYDFLSDEANKGFAALRRDEEFASSDPFVKYLLNEQLVKNDKNDTKYFNAHALDDDFLSSTPDGKALRDARKTVVEQVGQALGLEGHNASVPSKVAGSIFREGNEKFAVGWEKNNRSPTAGIEVKRDPNTGAVDTGAFLEQFSKMKLGEAIDQAGVKTGDTPTAQAKKLWAWLETRINVFRRRGNTGLNKTSSRSHVLYIITDDTLTDPTAPGKIFCLADFAGTEDLSFLVPPDQIQAMEVKKSSYSGPPNWFSVALPPQANILINGDNMVPLTLTGKAAKAKSPANTITRLAKATFLQETNANGLVNPKISADSLWTRLQQVHFLSTKIMGKLPPLQQESHNITRSLEQFKEFLKQHRAVVDQGTATGVDCKQFTIDHHEPHNITSNSKDRPVIGYKIVEEPCLLVQKLLCPLVTLDSSLVVLGAFAPRATDDLNSYNTASFISDCGCGADGKMKCQA